MITENLITHVRLAINPHFQDWVLFRNGTYIIFDDVTTIDDIRRNAIAQMEAYGPVSIGNPAGDFGVRWSREGGQKKDVYFFCHGSKTQRGVARQTA